MNSVDDGAAAETAATKRARLESKFLRKRFSFHHRRSTDDGPTAGKPNRCRLDTREKNARDPATSVIGEERESNDQPEKVAQEMDDEDKALERLAAQELLQEAARAKVRADIGGPSEYKRKPGRVNRRFVVNSLLQTEAGNRRHNRISKKE